ncbi:MAG TPA: molybdopterin cofactor-binding domain-containing protein, partial [Rhizomicrobium sp.]
VARALGIDALEFRRRNVVRKGEPMIGAHVSPDDVIYGSYGLDQCLDLVDAAMRGDSAGATLPPDWLIGQGTALTMIDTVPPGGHYSDTYIWLEADGRYAMTVGTAEFGNGTTTVHRQIAASVLGAKPSQVTLTQSDTDHGGHDTGAYGSTGTVIAGRATEKAAQGLRDVLLDFAASHSGAARADCKLADGAVICGAKTIALADLRQAAAVAGVVLSAHGTTNGIPRSVAFNVQGFRIAVNRVSGEIKILKSVQSADAGTVINPMQCRAQVEGGVAQALGAALFEEVVIDESGRVANPSFRHYRIPGFADIPRTEVLFAETSDTLGPFGAKSMSESPYNPVAAALGNAIRDATGVRCYRLPFKPDRLYAAMAAATTG